MSNFSFSQSVFYQFEELSATFIKLWIVVYKCFQFGKGLKMSAAVCLNLDQSEILLSGNGLIHSHTMTPFDASGKKKPFENTVG